MALRRRALITVLLFTAICVAVRIHDPESLASAESFFSSLYGSLCESVFRFSHVSLAFNRWLMLAVAGILVFFRLRRKHQLVFSSTRLSHELHALMSMSPRSDEITTVMPTSMESAGYEFFATEGESAPN